MAKLKAFLTNLDGLDQSIASLYREDGDAGGYVLDAEDVDGWGIANVEQAKAGLSSSRRERDAARKELAALKKERETLAAQVAQLEADIEAATEGELDKKAIEEQVAKKLERQFKAQLDAVTAERDTHAKSVEALKSEYHSTLIDSEIARAASGGKWSFSPKVLGPHVRGRMRVVETEDGKREVVILDATGEPKIGSNGKPAVIDDLFAEYTRDQEFSQFITRKDQQPPKSGSDARSASGNRTSTPGKLVLTQDDLNDFDRYQSLKAQAAKEGRELVPPGA